MPTDVLGVDDLDEEEDEDGGPDGHNGGGGPDGPGGGPDGGGGPQGGQPQPRRDNEQPDQQQPGQQQPGQQQPGQQQPDQQQPNQQQPEQGEGATQAQERPADPPQQALRNGQPIILDGRPILFYRLPADPPDAFYVDAVDVENGRPVVYRNNRYGDPVGLAYRPQPAAAELEERERRRLLEDEVVLRVEEDIRREKEATRLARDREIEALEARVAEDPGSAPRLEMLLAERDRENRLSVFAIGLRRDEGREQRGERERVERRELRLDEVDSRQEREGAPEPNWLRRREEYRGADVHAPDESTSPLASHHGHSPPAVQREEEPGNAVAAFQQAAANVGNDLTTQFRTGDIVTVPVRRRKTGTMLFAASDVEWFRVKEDHPKSAKPHVTWHPGIILGRFKPERSGDPWGFHVKLLEAENKEQSILFFPETSLRSFGLVPAAGKAAFEAFLTRVAPSFEKAVQKAVDSSRSRTVDATTIQVGAEVIQVGDIVRLKGRSEDYPEDLLFITDVSATITPATYTVAGHRYALARGPRPADDQSDRLDSLPILGPALGESTVSLPGDEKIRSRLFWARPQSDRLIKYKKDKPAVEAGEGTVAGAANPPQQSKAPTPRASKTGSGSVEEDLPEQPRRDKSPSPPPSSGTAAGSGTGMRLVEQRIRKQTPFGTAVVKLRGTAGPAQTAKVASFQRHSSAPGAGRAGGRQTAYSKE